MPVNLLALVEPHLGRTARVWAARHRLDPDDLHQAARLLVLARAAEFDPARSSARHWAKVVAKGAVRDAARAAALESAAVRGWRLDKGERAGVVETDDAADREQAERVAAALEALPADQAGVMRRLYGIGCVPAPSVQALAEEMGWERKRLVRQIARASAALRAALSCCSR